MRVSWLQILTISFRTPSLFSSFSPLQGPSRPQSEAFNIPGVDTEILTTRALRARKTRKSVVGAIRGAALVGMKKEEEAMEVDI